MAAHFRRLGVPVVMGGIHATMRLDETAARVDSVVTGEAEGVWPRALEDVRRGRPERRYDGGLADINAVPLARHDLLPPGYAFGAIQTTRGCPLNCCFCSVTAFNGLHSRQRPIADVVREFQLIRERRVLVVDDNLIGTRREHIARAKDLFRAMAQADLRKQWVAQATINFADDEERMALAAKAGCRDVFIGFESATLEGLLEIGKKFNLLKGRDFRASVRRIQQHNILVAGSFIMGLDEAVAYFIPYQQRIRRFLLPMCEVEDESVLFSGSEDERNSYFKKAGHMTSAHQELRAGGARIHQTSTAYRNYAASLAAQII